MGSTFGSLEIAKTGIYVSQLGIDVTGQNITNADTEGYTRQVLTVEAIDAYTGGTRYLEILSASVGGGVEAESVDQIRSNYLDTQYRSQNADLGMWDVRAEEMGYLEEILSDGTDNAISDALSSFYDSLNELSVDPVSEEIRTNVQQNAIMLAETLNYYYEQLVDQQNLYNESMGVVVDEINAIVESIAAYNEQIHAYELSGETANDLRDQRNLLLDELSGLVNIEYSEDTNGYLTVTVEGQTLVDHTDYNLLEVSATLTGAVSGETGYYEILIDDGTGTGTYTTFTYSSGELQAYTDLRDGNSEDNMGVPYILTQLNTLAQSITEEFNALNNAGYTMPYDSYTSQTGVDMFEVPAGGISDVTAGNFSISAALEESGNNIAASDTYIDLTAANTQEGNNVVALEMVAITTSDDLATVGSFDGFLESFFVEFAIDTEYAETMYESQESIVDNIETRRESLSGVSVDEEMINLIKYQHAYSAASRLINVIDENLDKLINSTGMVGR